MDGACSTNGGGKKCIKIVIEGKRLLGRPMRGLEDDIKTNLNEIVWESVDWVHLVQDSDRWLALVNTVMNL
jgi:hypothetical protein